MRWTGSSVRAALGAAMLLSMGVAPAETASPSSARKLYDEAQAAEKRLHQSKARLGKKSEWIAVARKYRNVVAKYPQSGYCDDSLYFEAEIYREVYRRFDDDSANERALDTYLLLGKGYPSSKWAPRAYLNRGKILLPKKSASAELEKVTSEWPNSTEAAEARRLLSNMVQPQRKSAAAPETFPPGIVGVRGIRHWTGTEYTRIVIDLDSEVKYREGSVEDPARIYFDLLGARVTQDLAAQAFPVGDGFLQQIRVGQNQTDVVRVVLDFQNVSQYNVFSLPDPYRLVVDILGEKPTPRAAPEAVVAEKPIEPEATVVIGEPAPIVPVSETVVEGSPPVAVAEPSPDIIRVPPQPRDGRYSVVQQLGLSASRVILDPGHGGHDPGTMNNKGLREKDIALDVAKRVRKLLEADGIDVLMTRERDLFIPLEERTAIANSKEADLFVSIHVNASRSTKHRGTETYYLNLATSPDAEEVAARENAVTTRRLGELQSLLQKVMNNSRIAESRELAGRVQGSMSEELFTSRQDPRNRGVKTAPFYVLLGAQMPAVLVEVAYLTNRKDAELLDDPAYRQKLAESIASGIKGYQDSLVRTTKAGLSGAQRAEKNRP